jgi:hypothetical protein
MTLIASIDGPNRLIYLHADTVGATVNPIDIYKEMRAMRRADEVLRQYDRFLDAAGNVSKGGGKFTERYVIAQSGTKIVPFNTDHELTINGTIITDDGQEGIACFDRSPLSGTTIVDINYVPPQVEVIRVGSGLDVEQSTSMTNIESLVAELHKLQGLLLGMPMTVTKNSRIVDDITLSVSGNPETSITVERQ